MKPQAIVADDHRLVADGIVKILEKEYRIVATPTDGRSFIEAVQKLRPHLALVDISLPLLNGLDACRKLKVVILTMHTEPYFVNEAFRVGVEGYVIKSSLADELVFATKEVLRGYTYISPVVAPCLLLDSSPEPPRQATATQTVTLTQRQREVLQMVAEGKSNKEVAAMMKVTVKTIEFHKSRILKELGAHSTAELTKHAITLGLVTALHRPSAP